MLLVRDGELVKTEKFGKGRYIGDPINAVRLFNDLHVDELVILDISASENGVCFSWDLLEEISEEANMPFIVGGGISSTEQIQKILAAGAEKVVLCNHAISNPALVKAASDQFGSSSVSVCINVKKNIFGKYQIYSKHHKKAKTGLFEWVRQVEDLGVGEIIVQSVDRDGLMQGYDIGLVRVVSEVSSVPIVALGGAGRIEHLQEAFSDGKANGLAAGSLFVFWGSEKGVLINYPERNKLQF